MSTPHESWRKRQPAALWFAEQGYSIVFVPSMNADLSDCTCPPGSDSRKRQPDGKCAPKNRAKHPRGTGWQDLATRDPATIRANLRTARQQYGIFPKAGSRLVVIDLDDTSSAAARLPWPDTIGDHGSVDSRTGERKWHRYYRLPDGVDEASVPVAFDGGEVCVAGSKQAVGPWSQTAAGPERERFGPQVVAELPRDILAAIGNRKPAPTPAPGAAIVVTCGCEVPASIARDPGGQPHLLRLDRHLWQVHRLRDRTAREVLLMAHAAVMQPPYADGGAGTIAGILDWDDEHPGRMGDPDPDTFLVPEDRGTATLSPLGDTEYVEDYARPGRIVVVAAEEGTGKSFTIDGELGIRLAAAGGKFAGTWRVLVKGNVLVLSEMHPDDDYGREEEVLGSLGLTRGDLAGRYFRLPLMTAAGGRPALTVPDWRTYITAWMRDHQVIAMIVDTATGATQVDPWGRAIQEVFSALRVMQAEYPELAIFLLLHLKKPQGRGERRLSDVLGEWGRWCDVVTLMEDDGLARVRITTRKRVRHQRRIVATKAGGLLIDPVDLEEAKGTKVPRAVVLAAIVKAPGITHEELGKQLGVSKDTASNYTKALGTQVERRQDGPRGAMRVYPTAEPPNSAEHEGFGGASVVPAAEGATTAEPPNRRIDTAVGSSVVGGPAAPPDTDPGDLLPDFLRIFGDDVKGGVA